MTTYEILSLIISLSTPILVLIAGLLISKKIEKNKLVVLKEKEWQVKWAEMFLEHATDFNDNISKVICSLFLLQTEKEQSKIKELINAIKVSQNHISEIDWNIQNYAQFSEKYKNAVIENQQKLMSSIRELIKERKGDLEEVRKLQFEYNNAVRKAHGDILNIR